MRWPQKLTAGLLGVVTALGSMLLILNISGYQGAEQYDMVPTVTLTLGGPALRTKGETAEVHDACVATERALSTRVHQLLTAGLPSGAAQTSVDEDVTALLQHFRGQPTEAQDVAPIEPSTVSKEECVATLSMQQLIGEALSSPMRFGALLSSPQELTAVWVYDAHRMTDTLVLQIAIPHLAPIYMGALETLAIGRPLGPAARPASLPPQSRLVQLLRRNGLEVEFALWQSGLQDIMPVANRFVSRPPRALLFGAPATPGPDPLAPHVPLVLRMISDAKAGFSSDSGATLTVPHTVTWRPSQPEPGLYVFDNSGSKPDASRQLQMLEKLQQEFLRQVGPNGIEQGPCGEAWELMQAAGRSVDPDEDDEPQFPVESIQLAPEERPVQEYFMQRHDADPPVRPLAVARAFNFAEESDPMGSRGVAAQQAMAVRPSKDEGVKSGGLYNSDEAEKSEPLLVGKAIEEPSVRDVAVNAVTRASVDGPIEQESAASHQVVAGGAGSVLTKNPFGTDGLDDNDVYIGYDGDDDSETESPLERLQALAKYLVSARASAPHRVLDTAPQQQPLRTFTVDSATEVQQHDAAGDDMISYAMAQRALTHGPLDPSAPAVPLGAEGLAQATVVQTGPATQSQGPRGPQDPAQVLRSIDQLLNPQPLFRRQDAQGDFPRARDLANMKDMFRDLRRAADLSAMRGAAGNSEADVINSMLGAEGEQVQVDSPQDPRGPRMIVPQVDVVDSQQPFEIPIGALPGPIFLQLAPWHMQLPRFATDLQLWLLQQGEQQMRLLSQLGLPVGHFVVEVGHSGRRLLGVNWALTGPGIALAALGLLLLAIGLGACCARWRQQRRERKLKKQDIAKRFPMGAQFYDPVKQATSEKGSEKEKLKENDMLAHQLAMQREAELIRARHGHGVNPAARGMVVGTPTGTPGPDGRPITPLPYRAETPLPAYARAGQAPWRNNSFYSNYQPPGTPGPPMSAISGHTPNPNAFPGGYQGIAAVAGAGAMAGRPMTATRMTPAGLDQRPGTAMSGMSGWSAMPPGTAGGARPYTPQGYQPPMGQRYNPQGAPNMSQPPSRSLTPLAQSVEGTATPRGGNAWTPPDAMSTYGSQKFDQFVNNMGGHGTDGHTPVSKSSDPRYTPASESRPGTTGGFSAYDAYSRPSSMMGTPQGGQTPSYGVPGTPLYPVGRQFDPTSQRPIFAPVSAEASPIGTPAGHRGAPGPAQGRMAPTRQPQVEASDEPETQSTSSKVDVSLASGSVNSSFLRSDVRLGQL